MDLFQKREEKKAPTPYESQDKKIKSNEIFNAIQDITNKAPLTDFIPTEIEEKIQAIIDITPKKEKIIDVIKNVSTNSYNVPDDVDFYLTNISIMVGQNGNIADPSAGQLGFTLDSGESVNLWCACAGGDNGEANNNSISIQFPKSGIKLKRGSSINPQTANANFVYSAMIAGYTVDTNIYTMNEGK